MNKKFFVIFIVTSLSAYAEDDLSKKDVQSNVAFTNIKLPTIVSSKIEGAYLEYGFLFPKFKRAEYDSQEIANESADSDHHVIEVLPKGLLMMKHYSSSGFIYEIESFAGLFFTKARFIGFGDGETSITSDIALSFPNKLEEGRRILISQKQSTSPLSESTETYEVDTYCLVSRKYSAKGINHRLSGMATELVCDRGTPNSKILAFLDDYGFALTLSMGNTFSAPTRYVYSNFKFE